LTEDIVCFRQTEDGREIVLNTRGIGENSITVKERLVESAMDWGYVRTKGSPNGRITSLSPKPHLDLNGIQIESHEDKVLIRTLTDKKLPLVARNIIVGAYCFARECEKLNTGITS